MPPVNRKFRRAKEHLDAFEDEASRVHETVTDTLVTRVRFDPDTPRFLVEVVEEPDVSLRLSTIAGDVVNNLRSVLDHVAYQLPILATGVAWEKTQWPIVATTEEIDNFWRFKGLRDRLVKAKRGDLWAVVESHQAIGYVQQIPSPDGYDLYTQRYRDLPLFVLADMSNTDKHRLLLEPFINIDSYVSITPRCVRHCANARLIESWGLWFTLKKNAAPLMQFTADITGPDPEMEVDFDFVPLPVGLIGLPAPALEWLVLMADAVRAVLEDFAPHFEVSR